MAGFNVNSNAAIGSNFYGAGFTVNITAPVDGNVTAAGRTVALSRAATVGGNVPHCRGQRLAGTTGAGRMLVSAETLTLSGTIAGDFRLFGRTIEFAPGARIDGAVDIHAPEAIAVPASVAPADRVSYASLEDSSYVDHAGRTSRNDHAGILADGGWFCRGAYRSGSDRGNPDGLFPDASKTCNWRRKQSHCVRLAGGF